MVFIEGTAASRGAQDARGTSPRVQIGTYSGSGIGLTTDGDPVNLFNPAGTRVTA